MERTEGQVRGKRGNESHELCAVHRKIDFKQTQTQIYFIYLNTMNIYFATSELPKRISELFFSWPLISWYITWTTVIHNSYFRDLACGT